LFAQQHCAFHSGEKIRQQILNGVCLHAAEQVDSALRALRMLSEQTHLLDCTSESVTEGVRVEITSVFLQASPHQTSA
jgi:hypothetical protein